MKQGNKSSDEVKEQNVSLSRTTPLSLVIPLLLFPLFLFIGSVQAAEPYYIWVDEDGVTNYSQRIPKGYDSEYVTESSKFGYNRPATQGPDTKGQDSDDSTEGSTPEATDMSSERESVQHEIARVKSSNCQVGKANLARLEAYARIRIRDDDGQEHVMTDDEKQERIRQAQATIRENCVNS